MQQWKVSKARLHNCYRLSGRSESPGPTVETITEDMSRARAVSVPCGGFNASGFALDGREVSPEPSESFMSTPPPPPPSPEHHHAQAEDLLPDPHVSVNIEEASAASELAANLNMALGSNRSFDGDHGDEGELDLVTTASNDGDDLDFIFNIFTTAVQEYNRSTAILKQYEEKVNVLQAVLDSIQAFWRQKKAEKVAEALMDDPAFKEFERDLNAMQADIDMSKASTREAEGFTNAFMDRWTKFAAEGSIE
ncbi:hypothetical protein NEUTE1DRAFT_103361 [Neurospora tetrasperma FGSC 2508]|uniref:Uncharacterized protein n=1 Tax=Neurospora tetrasperma (strain FGSC 2508 / ATCC MYA-4615 / P0657) TaxID=510951 RepID=F8MSZ6_NEUT8|nr:uncharacterized protein NEUTE1DRAFT_103361 [Neurospora tetrasperma FGSC 2508]EGO55978.1 hypothetical protein NEUTE1DRAFT_103361 [Neurospora tetrasperma FGSC 2508]EGZ68761.1 hypothetical protein NEUTE2DRAFT_168449 [Neurospora tetrasperma FGSC 2509]